MTPDIKGAIEMSARNFFLYLAMFALFWIVYYAA